MGKISVEPICNLQMVTAECGRIEANGPSPSYGYRIAVNSNGENIVRFDVKQESTDELAKELGTLAAFILTHSRHRGQANSGGNL
jgi:hypothetical protein